MKILLLLKTFFLTILKGLEIKEKKLTPEVVAAKGKVTEVKAEVKVDKIKDRHQKKEPKDIFGFYLPQEQELLDIFREKERILYQGRKEDIIILIQKDPAKILKRNQTRYFKNIISRSDADYFIITLHPLTVHE